MTICDFLPYSLQSLIRYGSIWDMNKNNRRNLNPHTADSASASWRANHCAAIEAARSLLVALENRVEPRNVDWAHVGDMAALRIAIDEVRQGGK